MYFRLWISGGLLWFYHGIFSIVIPIFPQDLFLLCRCVILVNSMRKDGYKKDFIVDVAYSVVQVFFFFFLMQKANEKLAAFCFTGE